jgi:hypothetical protein
LHLIGVKLGSATIWENVNQSEWLENTAQCEAVFCTLGGQTETTLTGWTCKVKNANKTMVMEDLREDDRILKYTLIKVLWNNVD